jgi:two-component system KDP operon response regulator KdpE
MAVDMVPMSAPERETRGPGCTDFCRVVAAIVPGVFGRTELLLHDARSHEAFGRSQVGPNGMSGWDVATGPLLIRAALCEAYVDGVEIKLTPTEWRIVEVLARSVGRVVPGSQILVQVWGAEYWAEHHMLRVNIARLRAKLGDARHLLVTKTAIGYRMVSAPYTGPTP